MASLVAHCGGFRNWTAAFAGTHCINDCCYRSCRSAHFLPFLKLPLVAETGELLVHCAFHLHGRPPRDVVSIRFWRCLTTQDRRPWLSNRDVLLQVDSKKLPPWFVGRFEVERLVSPAALHLTVPASIQVHPTFHVSQIKPVSWTIGARVGCGPEEWSWIPHRCILNADLLRVFSQDQSVKPGRAPGGTPLRGWCQELAEPVWFCVSTLCRPVDGTRDCGRWSELSPIPSQLAI